MTDARIHNPGSYPLSRCERTLILTCSIEGVASREFLGSARDH